MIFCFCLANVGGKFHQYFAFISKMSMEISIDILLLSVNQIRICKVFSQIFSGNKFTKNEQFLLKRFTSGKNIVF